MDYAELHAISNYSFLVGASFPDELVIQADKLGYRAIAITDECSLSGIVRAHNAAKKCRIKLIVGSEFYLEDGIHLFLLATNRNSYGTLCRIISLARRATIKGQYRLTRQDIEHQSRLGLLALWSPRLDATSDVEIADGLWIKSQFPEAAWIAISLLRDGNDGFRLIRARHLSKICSLPPVACGDVELHHPERQPIRDILHAIREKKPLSEMGYRLHSNAEQYLRPMSHISRLYPSELIQTTIEIADRCQFSLDEIRYEYPDSLTPEGYNDTQWLAHLTEKGAKARWPSGVPTKIINQIKSELGLIQDLRYEPYFLTVHDIVQYAQSQSILCQGRGSAANSVVCYCLGITAVDPTQINLLFERFISRERNEPPDIDVDFEHERREEVIQYIYRKYGRDHAALAATVITYQPKSAIRDISKALGLSLDQADRLAKSIQFWDDHHILDQRLKEAGFDSGNPRIRQLMSLVQQLVGFPRHLSQHVGGFVISRGPLNEMVPVEDAAMPERTVIQWEKDDLESLGLLKVDVLALGMLSAIRKCFSYIEEYSGKRYALHTIEQDDPKVYGMIQRADTIGVFQIESRAQMSMLPRLKPANYYDLVVEIAIVRPGPIQGDMVHPYLKRRDNPELVNYPSAALEEVLKRTLGVPIFQEQVMKIAIVAAGFSAGEADQLRRSMAAWKRKGGLEKHEEKLKEGMLERGYSQQFSDQIFNQIKGFGDYGFPESHSASFALLAYVSSWLKYYEPAAFCCALLNSQPMGFYRPSQLINDAKQHGVEIRPIDINTSQVDSSLAPSRANKGDQPAVRLGLRLVKGLSKESMDSIISHRSSLQFKTVQELAQRCHLEKSQIATLAAADALATISGNRHHAYWQATGIEPKMPLTGVPKFTEATPLLRKPTEWQNTLADYESTGLTLGHHPLALLRQQLNTKGIWQANSIGQDKNNRIIKVAGLVTNRQRPMTATGVVFVTLEDETGYANIVIWPQLVKSQRRVLLQSQLMVVTGRVQTESNVTHIIAQHLQDYSELTQSLKLKSRNFH
ncbi:MAG: DNA polymerase III subunit alpha [Gammaproteobacteria bacterium]|nr:DNA polymerase III subunit alpha [Gammaproteobacteria bacterium]